MGLISFDFSLRQKIAISFFLALIKMMLISKKVTSILGQCFFFLANLCHVYNKNLKLLVLSKNKNKNSFD